MPELFGFSRTFDIKDGVLIEKSESITAREALMTAQKDRLNALLKNAGGHIVPKT
jgi:hypothetical protein